MESGLTEYFDFLKEGLAQTGPFLPKPFYRPESDTLFFYGRDVPSYARRLNPLLTVFLANDDETLVGFKIKGVQRILRRMERLGKEKFVMHDDREGIRLTIFLEFALVAPPDEPAVTWDEFFATKLAIGTVPPVEDETELELKRDDLLF